MKLVEYVRDKKTNQRIGVVVAVDSQCVGWSLCRKNDTFDKEFGLMVATGRAEYGSKVRIPTVIQDTYKKMVERSQAYFQRANTYDVWGVPCPRYK